MQPAGSSLLIALVIAAHQAVASARRTCPCYAPYTSEVSEVSEATARSQRGRRGHSEVTASGQRGYSEVARSDDLFQERLGPRDRSARSARSDDLFEERFGPRMGTLVP